MYAPIPAIPSPSLVPRSYLGYLLQEIARLKQKEKENENKPNRESLSSSRPRDEQNLNIFSV